MRMTKWRAAALGLAAWVATVAFLGWPHDEAKRRRRSRPTTAPALMLLEGEAQAANPYPQGGYGKVAVLNTATAVPAAASSINGREGIALYNLGAATIYCGTDSSVTTSTGFPVPSLGSVTMALSYNAAPAAGVVVYCIAAVSQVSPADTRWLEVY